MRQLIMFILSGLLLQSGSAMAERQPIQYGNWSFDVEYDLIGIHQEFPGYTINQCIDSNMPYPNISRPGNECGMTMQGRFGRTVTWMVNCSTDWEMVQGMGRMHYHRDRAQGNIHMQILNPHNTPQSMVFRIRGHYLGPCDS